MGPHASELGRWQGDTDNGVMPTGQSADLIHEICSAKEVGTDIVQEGAKPLERLAAFPIEA